MIRIYGNARGDVEANIDATVPDAFPIASTPASHLLSLLLLVQIRKPQHH